MDIREIQNIIVLTLRDMWPKTYNIFSKDKYSSGVALILYMPAGYCIDCIALSLCPVH